MKIAIIGRGSAGARHERLFKALGVDVSAYDTDQTKTDAASMEEALEGADGVVVATPPMNRLPLLEALAKRNLPMLVEKPLAVTSDGLKDLATGGPPILMGYVWRHALGVQTFLASVGDSLHIYYGEHWSLRPCPPWLREVSSVFEYSHAIDFLLWLSPEPEIFKARGRYDWSNIETTDGRLMIKCRTDYHAKPAKVWMAGGGTIWRATHEALQLAYAEQASHFLAVIRRRELPRVDGAQGLAVIEFIERACMYSA